MLVDWWKYWKGIACIIMGISWLRFKAAKELTETNYFCGSWFIVLYVLEKMPKNTVSRFLFL